MSDLESYDDPRLAARARSWMQASAPVAAPERLVFGVMDEVDGSPRRRRLAPRGLPILTGVARYAALTLVITIGVAAGILVSRNIPTVGNSPPPPTPTPSLHFVGNVVENGRLLASDTTRAWVVADGRRLLPINADGSIADAVDLTFSPSDLVAKASSTSPDGGAETLWLVAPDSDLVRIQSNVGELAAARGSAGARVVLGDAAAWVSRTDAIVKVDAALMTVLGTFPVPGHAAEAPVVAVDGQLWVATSSGISRLDTADGDPNPGIPLRATALVVAHGLVWAAHGRDLVAIDPDSGAVAAPIALPTDLGDIATLATHGDVVWLATKPGLAGPALLGVDAATGAITSMTPLATPAISIAVVGNQVWTLDAGGHVGRFEPGP